MRIAVLGPLEVLSDERAPIALPGAKERLLLAVLAADAPAVVSTDRLTEALWNGHAPPSAHKSLQAYVVRLRSALEPDRPRGAPGQYVVRRGPGYALAVGREDIDAVLAGDLAARGRGQLAAGDPVEAERLLGCAVELWRGEPYADWPDAPFAETERRRLAEVRNGALGGLIEARLALGRHSDVLPELEALVAEEPLREDWWRLLVLALYRAGRQADALAAARRARALLAEELGTEPGPELRRMEAAVLAQDPALQWGSGRPAAASPAAPRGACPYKGLAAYQFADASLFHGRRRLVRQLVARLVDAPLLVVSGPSGAGKSSVVRAGLLPALADGALPGSESWRAVVVTPGSRPTDALAGLAGTSPPDTPVVLVCDQLEELWAPAVAPPERGAFLDAVLGLLADGIVVRCVAVLRGDHVGRLAEHADVTERLGGALALVPMLTDAELREIVREPARTVGLAVEDELVDAVVADVLGRPGALPLLSTALVGTWERRRSDQLTLAGYLEAGGVAGALTRSAEAAFDALGPEEQEIARRLLVRLADVDDGGALVRRRVAVAELDLDGEEGAARRTVVEAFVRRRLLAVDDERLEVVHEALLTGWPRLARWLADDAAGREVRRRLGPAAREWQNSGRPDDELYRGARLAAALDWAGGAGAEVTPVERAFLDASNERADAELTEARDRADREAAARHRTRRLAGALAGFLALALVATVLAVRAQRQAQRASLVADANRLAALSTTTGSPDLSLLLAAEAVRLADTPETQDGLLSALIESGRAERAVPFPGDPVAAYLAGGGRTLFMGVGSQVVTWKTGPSTQARVLMDIPADWDAWYTGAPSPTDDVLMTAGIAGGRPWVRTVSAEGNVRLVVEGPAVGGLPLAGAYTADGRRVHLLVVTPDGDDPERSSVWHLTEVDMEEGTSRDTGVGGVFPAPVATLDADFGEDGGSVVLWDLERTTPALLVQLADGSTAQIDVQGRPASSSAFRALASGAAQLWDDGAVTLHDRAGAIVQQLDVHQPRARDVVLSADGTRGVTVGDGAVVSLWDVDPATGRWSQRESLTGHAGDVTGAALDPSGRRLFTVSLDHLIMTWDLTTDGGFAASVPALPGRWIANRPELVEPGGPLVAPTRPGRSYGGDRLAPPGPETAMVAATFLDPATGRVVDQVEVGETLAEFPFASSVAVSPDRRLVAVTWGLGTTVLDTRTREMVAQIPLPSAVVWCAGWTPDGSRLLLGTDSREAPEAGGPLVAVDTDTWRVDREIPIGGAAQTMETSPDGRVIAVAHEITDSIVILDAETLDVLRTVRVPGGGRAFDLSFSPDGRLLALAGEFGRLAFLDARTWRPAGSPVLVHDQAVLQVEWLRDGRTAVTTSGDGTVSLVDVERGLLRGRRLPASRDPGPGLAHVVPGLSDEIVVLSGERTGMRYPLEPALWLREACGIVGRDLTVDEWDRYLPGRAFEPTCTDLP